MAYASFWLADLAVAACAIGAEEELTQSLDAVELQNRWIDAAKAYAAGRFGEAAELYDTIGSRPDAAYARLRAGRSDPSWARL
jgi:hypothetical protein